MKCNGKYINCPVHVMNTITLIQLTAHVRLNWNYSVCTYLLHLIRKPRWPELCNQLHMCRCLMQLFISEWRIAFGWTGDTVKCRVHEPYLTLRQPVTRYQYSLGSTLPAASCCQFVIHCSWRHSFCCPPKTSGYIKSACGGLALLLKIKATYYVMEPSRDLQNVIRTVLIFQITGR